jgi:hypothetical protein
MHGITPWRSRWFGAVAIAALVAAAFISFSSGPAAADGPGGGSCNVLIDPSCTVDVGLPGDLGGGGGGGTGGGDQRGGQRGASDHACHNTDPHAGCSPCPRDGSTAPAPTACAAYTQNLFCSQLNPTGIDPVAWKLELQAVGCANNAVTPVNPAVLALQALATIRFPAPSGDRSPSTSLRYQGLPFTYVNLWTFYWTDPATWRPLSATATLRGVSATVSAQPVELDYSPGDGSASVACNGPGRAWTSQDGNGPPRKGACAYRYKSVTADPITSTQTTVWKITWTGTGDSAGQLPSLSTSTSGQLRVLQVQVVNR